MKKNVLLVIIFATAAITILIATRPWSSSSPSGPPAGDGKPVVFTTFYPTTYFTRRIAGDLVDVRCPVPADADPIFFTPDAETIRAYQSADLIILNGAEFEKWVEKVSLPLSRIVETAQSFREQFIRYESSATHSHGREGEHSHEGLDGHTWLSPPLAIRQATAIRDALGELLPDHREALGRGFAALRADLQGLDDALREVSRSAAGRRVYASHPAYNYLAREYGWTIVNLDLDPEEMPTRETISELAKRLDREPASHILWEGEPLETIAERLRRELGLSSVVFSPCEMLDFEQETDGADYLTLMKGNIERVRAVFGP